MKKNLKLDAIKETAKYSTGLFKIWDKKTPAQLIFFITNRCNSRCSHCFYWKSLNKDLKDELGLLEIEKISKSMGRIFWLFLSGGEPFLRKDIVDICKTFYNNNHPSSIVIPTNGILVDKIIKDTKEIAKNSPKAKIIIQISVDDVGQGHDRVRGIPGNFDKIKVLVPRLKKLKLRYKNLAVAANIVFSAYNQDRAFDIYDYIYKQFKIDNICLSLVRGQPKEIGAKKINLDKYFEVHRKIRKTGRFAQYTPFLSRLITKKEDMQVEIFLKSWKEKKAVIPCLSGFQSAVLYPNGDLSLCELRKEIFGNLREAGYDFNKLWQSKISEEIRKRVKGCYCTQECVYTTNVFLNPKAWPMFLKYLTLNKI